MGALKRAGVVVITTWTLGVLFIGNLYSSSTSDLSPSVRGDAHALFYLGLVGLAIGIGLSYSLLTETTPVPRYSPDPGVFRLLALLALLFVYGFWLLAWVSILQTGP
jgi:hypothetical protein